HATAGELGDLLGGRETRFEDEAVQIAIGKVHFRAEQTERNRLAPDGIAIHAAAVVADAQDDFRRFARNTNGDGAIEWLVRGKALLRRLDAVGQRVAQHVLERRLHALEQ